jgi:hypothetical protein
MEIRQAFAVIGASLRQLAAFRSPDGQLSSMFHRFLQEEFAETRGPMKGQSLEMAWSRSCRI